MGQQYFMLKVVPDEEMEPVGLFDSLSEAVGAMIPVRKTAEVFVLDSKDKRCYDISVKYRVEAKQPMGPIDWINRIDKYKIYNTTWRVDRNLKL